MQRRSLPVYNDTVDEGIIRERGIRRSRTRSQRIVALFVVAGVAGIAVAAWLLLRPRGEDFTVGSWTSAAVVRRTMTQTLQVSGTMDVERQEDVVALHPGTLASIGVAVGDRVKQGQVLARLSSNSLDDQLAQAESTLQKTRRDLEKLALENGYGQAAAVRARPGLLRAVATAALEVADAQRLLDAEAGTARELAAARDREMAARETLAKADADSAHAAAVFELVRRNMEADITLMTATAARLRENLDDLTVRAPFDGTVMDTYAQVGTFVPQYQRVLNLADTTHPQAILDVPEDAVDNLAVNQPVTVLSGSGRFAGTIARIGLEAQAGSSGSTATVPIYVTLASLASAVIPGSSATGEIVLGTREGALVLPRGSYLSSGSERWVFRIEGDEAIRTEVTYGIIQADEVEVLTGLSEGDRIVTSSYQDYIDRERVRLRPEGEKR